MPLYKSSQLINDILDVEDHGHDEHNHPAGGNDEVIIYDEKPSKDDIVEMHQPNEIQISFKLPTVPGADNDAPIEVTDNEIEVADKNNTKEKEDLEVADPWDWGTAEKFLPWLSQKMQNIPRHTGHDTGGIERTIAYLKKLNRDGISKAMQSDYNGAIDSGKAEEARAEIDDGISRLEERLESLMQSKYKSKKKKASDSTDLMSLIKEGKQAHVGGIIITVPLLISRIARVCINGMVSGGHDIEDIFARQVKEYDLDKREQSELLQLLEDMGYAMPRRDRGYALNTKIDHTSSDNMDLGANYPS